MRHIISRAEWKARPRKMGPPYPQYEKHGIIIHHTWVPGNGAFSTEKNKSLQRSMQNYHMDSGTDIYQAFTVFQNGDIMEGRAGGLFTNNGATYAFCSNWVGIENQGNFDVMEPPQATMDSLIDLCTHICSHGVPVVIKGHRDFKIVNGVYYAANNKTCPGHFMYPKLSMIEAEVKRRLFGHPPVTEEEEENMAKLQLDRKGGSHFDSADTKGYVYATDVPVKPGQMLNLYADVPDHDIDIRLYVLPVQAMDVIPVDIKIGGFNNSDNVHGGVIDIFDEYKKVTGNDLEIESWVTVHAKVNLHGGAN